MQYDIILLSDAKSLETVEEAAAGRQGRNFLWDQSSPLKAALIVKEVLEISFMQKKITRVLGAIFGRTSKYMWFQIFQTLLLCAWVFLHVHKKYTLQNYELNIFLKIRMN